MLIRRLALVLCLSSTLLLAQAPPRSGETIDVSIVNLDVVVTDRSGARVRNLTRDDFEIRENGKLQPITNFALYDDAEEVASETAVPSPGAAKAASIAPRQPRAMVLVIDHVFLWESRSRPFFAQIRQLLRDTVRPGDSVTIVSWSGGIMVTRQRATDKIDALMSTLDAIEKESGKPRLDRFVAEAAADAMYAAEIRESAAFLVGRGDGLDDPATTNVMQDRWVLEETIQSIADAKVRALEGIVRSMGAIDARKVLVLATARVSVVGSSIQLPCDNTMTGRQHCLANALDAARAGRKLGDLYHRLATAANANGVTVYPIIAEDIMGGRSTRIESRSYDGADVVTPFTAQKGFVTPSEAAPFLLLAKETGGELTLGVGAAIRSLPAIAGDMRSYYSIAYRANGKDGENRKISVSVKRPGFEVRSRRSYATKSEETRMEDRVISALFGDRAPSVFPVTIERSVLRTKSLETVEVRIPVASLTPTRTNDAFEYAFTVYVASSGMRGVSPISKRTAKFSVLAEDAGRSESQFYVYELGLVTDKAVKLVAIGIVDEATKNYGLATLDLRADQSAIAER